MYHKQLEEKEIPGSPIENYHVYFRKTLFLENIDFNLKDKNFKLLCADESDYENAIINENDGHIFRENPLR